MTFFTTFLIEMKPQAPLAGAVACCAREGGGSSAKPALSLESQVLRFAGQRDDRDRTAASSASVPAISRSAA
jgi:hypothetical protein